MGAMQLYHYKKYPNYYNPKNTADYMYYVSSPFEKQTFKRFVYYSMRLDLLLNNDK
jgi:hypothetical protein